MPRRMGRPPKDPRDRYSALLHVRLRESERALLDRVAKREGKGPSVLAREVLLRALKRRGK